MACGLVLDALEKDFLLNHVEVHEQKSDPFLVDYHTYPPVCIASGICPFTIVHNSNATYKGDTNITLPTKPSFFFIFYINYTLTASVWWCCTDGPKDFILKIGLEEDQNEN